MMQEATMYTIKIGNATGWSLAAQISAKAIVPITNMILARILAPEVFGVIAMVNMVITFADTFAISGLQKYLVQQDFDDISERDKTASVVLTTNLLISIVGCVIIWFLNDQIASVVGCAGHGLELCVAAFSIPLMSITSVYEALCQREFKFKNIFYRRIIGCVIPFIVTIPLALLGLKQWSLIIGNLVSYLAIILVFIFSVKWKPRLQISKPVVARMYKFGLWMVMEALLLWLTTNVDILVVGNVMGEYYTGLYKNTQTTVTGILSIITGATTPVMFSALSRLKDDKEAFEKTLYGYQSKVAMFVVPMGVGLFCFRNVITLIMMGEQWTEAACFLGIWGLCTALVASFGTFVRVAYRALGKPHLSVAAQFLHILIVVPICIFCASKGFKALALYRSLGYLSIIPIHMLFMKIFLKMSPLRMITSVKEVIFAALLMGGLAMGLLLCNPGIIQQIIYIIVCVLCYFGVLMIFPKYRNLIFTVVRKVCRKTYK